MYSYRKTPRMSPNVEVIASHQTPDANGKLNLLWNVTSLQFGNRVAAHSRTTGHRHLRILGQRSVMFGKLRDDAVPRVEGRPLGETQASVDLQFRRRRQRHPHPWRLRRVGVP